MTANDMHVKPSGPAFVPSGRRIGDYQLGQMIGAGGMGSVFLARQISMQRFVALKLLRSDYSSDPVYTERFLREIRLLAKLEDPHIVQAYEAGMDKGICFFAMEYVDGSDLKKELIVQKKLSEQDVLSIARDVSLAMAYAWNHLKMVHRDIKPANIIRTRSGETKLLDLGISKQMTQNDHTELTSNGLMVGSPTYISPEQASGQGILDFRSDIYSLGVTMYHLLAGHPPYDSSISLEVVAMHFKNPIPNLRKERSDISPGTSALIREMMSKDPGGRPSSWEEIERRTEKLLAQYSTVPCTVPCKQKQTEKKAKSLILSPKAFYLIAGVLLLLAAVLTALLLLPQNKRVQTPQKPTAEKLVSDSHIQNIQPDPEQFLNRKRESEIQMLRSLSGEKELKKDFEGALSIWKKYCPPSVLQNDNKFRKMIEEEIRYLEQRIAEQQDGQP